MMNTMKTVQEEIQKTKLHISVRNLVEFIFREGDIDNRRGQLANPEAMMEGSKLHRKIQKLNIVKPVEERADDTPTRIPSKFKFNSEEYVRMKKKGFRLEF